MGSKITINDTLKISREQGFPVELELDKHLENPYSSADFAEKKFSFSNKQGIRIYKTPPVRNFLVEYTDGKWIYWGLVHILSVTHDYRNETTSGTFKIISLYSPEDMRKAHDLIDRNEDTRYFKE